MEACPNCDALITCGCQRRTATDGKIVCTNCLASYEQQLTIKKSQDLLIQKAQASVEWLYNQNNT